MLKLSAAIVLQATNGTDLHAYPAPMDSHGVISKTHALVLMVPTGTATPASLVQMVWSGTVNSMVVVAQQALFFSKENVLLCPLVQMNKF